MKVKYLWAHGMSSIQEQGDLLKTLTHQATQNGILTKKWSSQEWEPDEMLEARTVRPVGGHPFTQHTVKFVIMTMIWTLTPSQNQTLR